MEEADKLLDDMLRDGPNLSRWVSQKYNLAPGAPVPNAIREELKNNYLEVNRSDFLVDKHREDVFNNYDQNSRVMCLSEPPSDTALEVPMWGYYADGHKGVRIHVTESFIQAAGRDLVPIAYPETPPALDLNTTPFTEKFQNFSDRVLSNKSKAWAHWPAPGF